MKTNRYKLLVVDIDGTLIDKDGVISDEDKTALASVNDSGIQVSLSTGRVILAARRILDQLSLDSYHMFFDGALVANPKTGEEVYVEPINGEVVREAVEFVYQHDINFDFYSSTRYFIEHESWVSDIRIEFFKIQPTFVDFKELWNTERIIKGTLVVRTDEERAKADKFCQHFKDNLSFSRTDTPAYPGVDFINVISAGVSKGKALEALASHLEIPLAEVMAIGDGTNDIPLLSRAGLSVAMGNARDEVKEIADYTTLDVDNNGVAAAIQRFLLL